MDREDKIHGAITELISLVQMEWERRYPCGLSEGSQALGELSELKKPIEDLSKTLFKLLEKFPREARRRD